MGSKQPGSSMSTRALTIVGLGRALELAVRETGLSTAKFRALSLVDAGITSSGLIARFLDVQPSTVTTVMDGLVADGLVDRLRGTDDRRRVDYQLTDRGSSTLKGANQAAVDALSILADNLEGDDRAHAFGGLDLWTRAIESRRRSHWGADAG
ncbi:MAG: MarR family winged helix-turn-helix transcriptional regulator [Acidimicrobiales bacterium]